MNSFTNIFINNGLKRIILVFAAGASVVGIAVLGVNVSLHRQALVTQQVNKPSAGQLPSSTTATPAVNAARGKSVATTATPSPKPNGTPATSTVPSATTIKPATPVLTQTPTPVPSPAPTPVPTPTPVPAPPAYPDASNTGWQPTGVTLTGSGGVTVNTAGTVIDGQNFTDLIQINANNVIIKRSKVSFTTQTYLIRVAAGVTGTIIEDVEINGGAGSYTGITGENITVRRVNISNVENGLILTLNSSLSDSYIHDLFNTGSPHYDGVEINGGSGITINHNTIAIPNETGTVNANNYFGPVSNIAITNNKLTGGTYTIYVDGQFTGGSITGVSITGNRIGGGQFGYALIRNASVTQSGNVDNATGNAITL